MQLDDRQLQLQLEKSDTANWKDKWAQENAKTDGIKRECMQVGGQRQLRGGQAVQPSEPSGVERLTMQ
jgi:hypothetical protein